MIYVVELSFPTQSRSPPEYITKRSLRFSEDSFLPEAERLEIPRGAPSELMLSKDGSDPDICVARRYFIRIKVFDRTREDPQLVLAESVIVVCGSAGDLHALTLCTNKQ